MRQGSPVFVGGSVTWYSAAIPIGVPSSGSIGDNGALTVDTPFPSSYSAAYLFFPTNAIFAGSAAGLYYTKMQTTQTGTIFNDILVPGNVPIVLTKPTPIVATGPGAYAQIGDIIPLLTIEMEGNSIGINGCLEIFSLFSMSSSGNAESQILLGDTLIQSVVTGNQASLRNIVWVLNRGVTNQQVFFPSNSPFLGTSGNACEFASIPTEIDFNVSVTGNIGGAEVFVILEALVLRLVNIA
jgi:hypothetical protein